MLTLQDRSALSRLSPSVVCVRIGSKRYGVYLHEVREQVKYCELDAGVADQQWIVEEFLGSRRIRNRLSGHYMTIQHQFPLVESISIEDNWVSAQWHLEKAADGCTLIRSVWRPWQFLHIQVLDGYVQYGGAGINRENALWVLEAVED